MFTDSNSGLRCQYGMKTKDATLDMSKRWYAEISDIREKFPLIMFVREKSYSNDKMSWLSHLWDSDP